MRTAPLTTATRPPITSTVGALSDRELLRETRNLVRHERHLQGAVIDHLTEIEARGLYLERGFSSLFDYAVRELGYSDAAAARRIGAMRLCADQPDAREGLRDGSLTLSAAAELQWAFDRQVRRMLADLDPELAPPADRVRPLGDGRYELKATIDAECQQGLEQLRGLLSHVDPRMTMGQLVGRLVREALAATGHRPSARAVARGREGKRRGRSARPPRRPRRCPPAPLPHRPGARYRLRRAPRRRRPAEPLPGRSPRAPSLRRRSHALRAARFRRVSDDRCGNATAGAAATPIHRPGAVAIRRI